MVPIASRATGRVTDQRRFRAPHRGTPHNGHMAFDFPEDLVRIQADWLTTDQARTVAAQSGDDEAFDAAHARLLDLTMALHRHAFMRACEQRYQARMELRDAARGLLAADG
jgi:hypothetical protein